MRRKHLLLLRNNILFPIHAFFAICFGVIIRLRSILTGQHIQIASLATYSFGALVFFGPTQTQQESAAGGETWIFMHGPTVKDQPFALGSIIESSEDSVRYIRSRLLGVFYSWYCPGHQEEPLYKTWRSGKLPSWASPPTVASSESVTLLGGFGAFPEAMKKRVRTTFDISANYDSLRKVLYDHGYSSDRHAGIVCLNVRDSQFRLNQGRKSVVDISSSNPRNSDVRHFNLAIKAAIDNGYFCVRVGKTVSSPLSFQNDNVWDYAASSFHDERLDVLLAKECDLAVTTVSGWDVLCNAFGRPTAFINVGEEFFWGTSIGEPVLLTPKKVIEIETGRIVRASELAYSAAFGHEIWRDLQSSSPQRYQILGLTDLEILESVELALNLIRGSAESQWQLDQRKEISKFWKEHMMPLGYQAPKKIPAIPPNFYQINRSWLVH